MINGMYRCLKLLFIRSESVSESYNLCRKIGNNLSIDQLKIISPQLLSIYNDWYLMQPQMKFPGRYYSERLLTCNFCYWIWRIIFFTNGKHFFGQRAVCFLIVKAIFQAYFCRVFIAVFQFERKNQGFPDLHPRRMNFKIGNRYLFYRTESKHGHCFRITLLQQSPATVFD